MKGKNMSLDVNGVNFRGSVQANSSLDVSAQQRFQRTAPQQADTFEKQNKSNKTKKIIAGVVAAAAAIGVAAILTKKGKSIPLEEFKSKGGQLIKGEAIAANGEKYTGSLKHIAKDGTTFKLKYKDGQLIESLKNGKLLISYEKMENDITRIFRYDNAGKKVLGMTVIPNKPGDFFKTDWYNEKGLKILEGGSLSRSGSAHTYTQISKGSKGINTYINVSRTVYSDPPVTKFYLNGHEVTSNELNDIIHYDRKLDRISLKFD